MAVRARCLVREKADIENKKDTFDRLLKKLDKTVLKKNEFTLSESESGLLQEYRIGNCFSSMESKPLWQAVRKQALAIHRAMIGIDAEIQQKEAALKDRQAILLDLKKACNRKTSLLQSK